MSKINTWFKYKLIEPIRGQLSQGYSIEKVSMSIAVGLAVACTPVIGISTALGIIIATIFSLNHVVLQTINYIAYPLHLALIIPFLMLGQRVFSKQIVSLNLKHMLAVFEKSPATFFKTYGMIALHGLLLWIIAAPVIILTTYLIAKPLISALARVTKMTPPKVE